MSVPDGTWRHGRPVIILSFPAWRIESLRTTRMLSAISFSLRLSSLAASFASLLACLALALASRTAAFASDFIYLSRSARDLSPLKSLR